MSPYRDTPRDASAALARLAQIERDDSRTWTVAMIVVMHAALVVAMTSAGCGASAVRTHAQAATIAAVATAGAARMVEQSAGDDAARSCHDTTDDAADRACVDALRARWAPADAAIGSTRAALLAWVEALDVARLAGDGADLWAPLGLAAARMLVEYDALRSALAPLGVDLPALPATVIALAGAVGGE